MDKLELHPLINLEVEEEPVKQETPMEQCMEEMD